MRTQQEIVDRVNEIKAEDFFGFETNDLLEWLDFEHLSPFIKPEKREEMSEDWETAPLEKSAIIARARDYLPFAYEKCTGHRGISAGRSASHFRAWFWLLGDDEMVGFIDDETNFTQYGAPIIAKAAERLEVVLTVDEAFERMARGQICQPDGCPYEGCGQ